MDDVLSSKVGKELTPKMLGELLNSGKLSFPHADVTLATDVSEGTKKDCVTSTTDEVILKELIDSIAENEELVKTLEDMRDDLLKDMDISAASAAIADAARLINGNGNSNITKDTFDKAEAILDIWEPIDKGYVSQLIPIIGNTIVKNKIRACSDITKASFDGLEFAKGELSESELAEQYNKSIAEDIADTENEFALQLKQMFISILNTLFWDYIWTRIWVSIIGMIEKLIAVPIDTPIIILKGLLFKIPKLNKENYYKYGPIHRALNKFKMIILCKVPHNAWDDYRPEETIQIFWDGTMKYLVELCNDDALDNIDCLDTKYDQRSDYDYDQNNSSDDESKTSIDDDDVGHKGLEEDKGNLAGAFAEAKANMPDEGTGPCDIYDRIASGFDEMEQGKNITPECVAAAATVKKAALRDARFNNGRTKKHE